MEKSIPGRNPAEYLLGLTLEDGWRVVERVAKPPGKSGGNFSIGYVVERDRGERAFLKALDLRPALRSPDPARALQGLTTAFNFERDMLERCRSSNLKRVVRAVGQGNVVVFPEDPFGGAQYLIFELAKGDVRDELDAQASFDLAWNLRALHHISAGLDQLHRIGIAHQDVKPSNCLVFDDGESKVSDLGRAVIRGQESPHERFNIAGDPEYAPPELLYGHVEPDWSRRRLSCDLYLLGSMVVFFFSRTHMTALLAARLDRAHSWHTWNDSYVEVLPYLRDAFGQAVGDLAEDVPIDVRPEVVGCVRELCEPDLTLRGHPRNRIGLANPYSLERYVARFDLLARQAEVGSVRRLL